PGILPMSLIDKLFCASTTGRRMASRIANRNKQSGDCLLDADARQCSGGPESHAAKDLRIALSETQTIPVGRAPAGRPIEPGNPFSELSRTRRSSSHPMRRGRQKSRPSMVGLFVGVPTGIRTPVTAVHGRCTRPLVDGA